MPQDVKTEIVGGYTLGDFIKKLESSETKYNGTKPEYDKCMQYFEDQQAPSDLPTNKTYVEDNLITDLVRYLIGQVVGGGMKPDIKGGGEWANILAALHDDILKSNSFATQIVPQIVKSFYVTGLAGVAVDFNPYRLSPYGTGMPIIQSLKKGEFYLDADFVGMHDDDEVRWHRTRKKVVEMKRRYKDEDFVDQIQPAGRGENAKDESEQYCDLYTASFCYNDWVKNDKKNVYEEIKKFYTLKLINKTLMVEKARKSYFNRHFLIGGFHTPREETSIYPFGVVKLVTSTQENINGVKTVMYDAVKADIKNFLIGTGVDPSLEQKAKNEVAKTNGAFFVQDVGARIGMAPRPGMSPALIQMYQMLRMQFDEASGRHAPERGAVDKQMSGEALKAIYYQGTVPEFTAKLHLEQMITEISKCIIECFPRMPEAFSINAELDGKEQKIAFNGFQEGIEDVIYDLTKVDTNNIDIYTEVTMNVRGQKEALQNKALLEHSRGLKSTKNTVKALNPDNWAKEYEDLIAEQQALALVEKISEISKDMPEQMDNLLATVDKIIETAQTGKPADGNK